MINTRDKTTLMIFTVVGFVILAAAIVAAIVT
jgi:hypothetical protein